MVLVCNCAPFRPPGSTNQALRRAERATPADMAAPDKTEPSRPFGCDGCECRWKPATPDYPASWFSAQSCPHHGAEAKHFNSSEWEDDCPDKKSPGDDGPAYPTFTKGGSVQLKSGGPLMTVEDIRDDEIVCVWFSRDSYKLRRGRFHALTLK